MFELAFSDPGILLTTICFVVNEFPSLVFAADVFFDPPFQVGSIAYIA